MRTAWPALWIVCLAGCYPSLDDAPFLTRDAGSDTSDAEEPDVPAPGTTVFVDRTAAPGGNGAESRPFQTVSDALATEALVITVAAGEYEVPAEWSSLVRRRIVGVGPRTVFSADTPVRWTTPRGLELAAQTWSAHLRVEGDLIADETHWAAGLEVEGAASTTLDRCSASGAGVQVAGALQLTVTDLSITQTDGGALRLHVGTAEISDLTIEQTSEADDDEGDGVTIVGGVVTINRGSVTGAVGRGLTASGATVTLTGFHVADSGAGIWIAAPGGSITLCTVTNTARTGILLVGSPDRGRFDITQTVVRGATLAGLQLQNVDADVTSCEFAGTLKTGESGNGISVLDSHLDATSCLLEANATNGLYIPHPSSATLQANTYRDNGDWGILAVCGEDGAQPEITDAGSTYSGNGAGNDASVLCQ